MGVVWLAQDERLNESVALKFLPSEIRGDAAALDDLRRETARSHKLSHPNIVRIHDLHEDADGTAFIVMEYIDGQTLAALRLEQPARVLAWDYLRPLVAQLCAALEYAHGEKVIHRDLKPANIMVDSRGRLKLADFGIAAVASDSMSRVSVKHSTSGTLPYMSPQQVTGKRPQATDDLYALGATLYELLTGKPPFHSGDITHQVLHEPPEPMDERLAAAGMQNDVPPDAASLIMACLAKEPGQRPQSARLVAEWIGVEMVAKPSQESLAAAFFPQTPASPAEVAAGEPAGNIRSKPAGNWRKLAMVGFAVLVVAGAFWLGKVIHGRDKSTAPIAAKVPAQTSDLAAAPAIPFNTTAADAPDLKYGLYIHFGMDTFRHTGEKGQLPAERFAPASLNVKAWARAAKEAGMTFAILTAKHESGFCLWDSKDYDYDIAHSPYKGDIIGDFIAACKAEGILPGVHYSIPDAHNEGAARFQGAVPPPYFSVIKQHLTELNTKYPELRAIRLDGSTRLSTAQLDELSQIVKRLNPRCALWSYDKVGDGGTVISGWMWSPNAKLNPAQQLFTKYQQYQTAGKTFLLNVGPDPSGKIRHNQIAILMQMKNLIANSNAPVAKKLLIVETTAGARHSSIPTLEKVIIQLGKDSGEFTVDCVRQPAGQGAELQAAMKTALEKLSPESLKNYDGVVFASTTGDLPIPDKQGFLDWIKAGHAFIGIHAATDTFHGWPAYLDMLGAEFDHHGYQIDIECLNQDPRNPATAHLGKSWKITQEEVYQFKNSGPKYDPTKVHELLTLDKQPEVQRRHSARGRTLRRCVVEEVWRWKESFTHRSDTGMILLTPMRI